MGGVNVDGGNGKRRTLDSEINMIPMIDLLMVTISFLLITAVWVHSQRLEADAQVPGPPTAEPPCPDCKEEAKLHVETSDPSKFVLAWRQGRTVVRSTEIPREARRREGFPTLATKVGDEFRTGGVHHSPTDRAHDRAVVHAANDMPYAELVAIIDAVSAPQREVLRDDKRVATSAFQVTFAAD